MAGRNHLYIPGPTNVPNEILNAMHVPMEDHRSPIFPELLTPLLNDLKKIINDELVDQKNYAIDGDKLFEGWFKLG